MLKQGVMSVAAGALLLVVATAANGQDATEQETKKRARFESIFDGKSLEGWDGDPKLWSVVDGAITGRTTPENKLKSNSFLIWKGGEVENFVLRLKFRIRNGNSGIQYRSKRHEDVGKWSIGGYQADIDDSGRYMGILYEERGRGILAERGQKVILTRKENKVAKETSSIGDPDELVQGIDKGKWHDYEIRAQNFRLVHKINGKTMVQVVDRDRKGRVRKGILALQIHVGDPMEVQFKDIQLRKLPAAGQRAANQGGTAENAKKKTNASVESASGVSVLDNFHAERIYEVPSAEQGSWVALCVDDRGRIIASDQYGKLYRVTVQEQGRSLAEPVVETIDVNMGMAHGLCYAFDSLYVMVNNGRDEGQPSGFYRVRDTDGDDQFDSVELLRSMKGAGEHGPHAIIPSPDGKSLYICGGNHTDLPELASSRVPQVWKEDLLLPRMWDARGHARGRLAPGGWIIETDPDGKEFELVSIGYRNEYDIAFNAAGDLFTYDADMEWDIGAPWYRPTRVCFAASGSEFGWRSGTGKWPSYYPDNLPGVVDIGPGSPTGIAFGYGARFPAKYQKALFICDWSYGVIYAVHLDPDGAGYNGEAERFVAAAPLPATDIVVNPQDGALYFAVGGRRAQSALYRVTYHGEESTEPAEMVTDSANESAEVRRKLETWHSPQVDNAEVDPWKHLASEDRYVRYAARIAIEHQPVDSWRARVFELEDPVAVIQAVVALARHGSESDSAPAIEKLAVIDWDSLSRTAQLELLRAYSLVFIRLGSPSEQSRTLALDALDAQYPASHAELNHELAMVLTYLNAPKVVPRTLALLKAAPTQQSQIHYAFCLRVAEAGWNRERRQDYLQWFHDAMEGRGGMSFAGFLRNIREESIDRMTDQEREVLKEAIANVPQPKEPTADLTKREFVKDWKVQDLAAAVESLQGRDFENGRKMFATAQCFKCHRVNGEGESVGPDLTGVGRRFNAHDLLTAVIDPNQVISDQYQQTTFVLPGKVVTGRVVNVSGSRISIMTDMYDQSKIAGVNVDDILEKIPAEQSMMPTGLLNTFTENDLLDLMAYLISGGDSKHAVFQTEGG